MEPEMWHFEHHGQHVGPFTQDELEQLAKGRILQSDTRLIDPAGQTVAACENLDFGQTAHQGPRIEIADDLVTAEIVPTVDNFSPAPVSDGLSLSEFAGYGLAFLVLPMICVLVSSVLYYAWRSSQPAKARQINLLGFGVFFLQTLLGCVLGALAGM
ncbi:hypothetical protein GC197_16625 [bacterium]|nr:hypothetical protein [bacterium]